MKKMAYGQPILVKNDKIALLSQIEALNESTVQELVFKYPSCLPISEIDESFNPVLPVCTELHTSVGALDILMITPSGEIVIIETKLWRNPQARRVVVAQILDYAKELSKWTYEDMQREVNRRLGTSGNILYEIARKSDSNLLLNESDFVDSVSRNLKRGNFLLLIVGDGIREGAAGIAEFLVSSGYMNFTFAMIELAIYQNEEIGKILLPRVITKTVELQKLTVEISDGLIITDSTILEDNSSKSQDSIIKEKERQYRYGFWKELVSQIAFDDPGQPIPDPVYAHNLFIYPGKTRKIWISAYFMNSKDRVGVYIRCQNDSEGQRYYNALVLHKEEIEKELGENIHADWDSGFIVSMRLKCDGVYKRENRDKLMDFFETWLNTFVNIFRPKIKEIERSM